MTDNYRILKALRVLATLALILVLPLSTQAAMKMAPYLQAVTTDSIYVMVECDSVSPVTVQYGPTASYGSTAVTTSTGTTSASPVTYVHKIQLTGLSTDSLYHYRVTQDSVNYSSDFSFVTACLPGTPFRFAGACDFRSNIVNHNNIATAIKAKNPRFSIYGGDICNDGSYTTFKNEWFTANQLALDAGAPYFNSPGNHEGWSTNMMAFAQNPVSSSGTQAYYSFDYGDVHFVSINNQVSYTVGSAQYNWVMNDLATTTKPWKIVFFHYPAYCAGGHGEDAIMKSWTTNIFEPKKVSLVFTGHSHFYQHNLVNGLHHYVVGTAGAPFATPGTASYVVKSEMVYHYAIFDVSTNALKMTVYRENGTVLDSLNLARDATGAKSCSDGASVEFPEGQVVTLAPASEPGVFYAQDSEGIAGIRVETTDPRPARDAKVKIKGDLGTKANGERAILNAKITSDGTGVTKIWGINNKHIGGNGYDGGAGLSNQGLLVKVWGKVTKAVGGVFWVDDGAGVNSGETDGTKGVKIVDSGLTPAVDSYLKIDGVVASEKASDGKTIRVVKFRELHP